MPRTTTGPGHTTSIFPPRTTAAPDIDPARPLDRTTLLLLGTDAPDHRADLRALGAIPLHVGSVATLFDWLAAHRAAQAAVLIDDPRLSPQQAHEIATTLRRRFPDVAVALLTDPAIPLPDPAPSGCAVHHRPLTPAALATTMTAARHALPPDQDDPTGHWTTPPLIRPHHDDPSHNHDHHGPHSGRWIIPLLGLGVGLWITLGVALLGKTDAPGDLPAAMTAAQLS
jgi:hypothetical protein